MVVDQTSGLHQAIIFDAAAHFGTTGTITIVSNSYYSGAPIAYVRLKQGSTYDGAVVQIYMNSATNSTQVYMFDNLQSSGWVLKNFVNDNTNPGTVAAWASLSERVRSYLSGDRNGLTMNATGFALGYDSNPRLTQSTAIVAGAANAQLRIQNDNAWYDVGAVNSSWVHNRTNASNGFYWYQYGQNESSWRAPIFYDADDTTYYVNPNSSSYVNGIVSADYIRVRSNKGIMGDYDSDGTASKVIWTIGASWPLANMYGIGYEYGSGYDHHLALRNNGSTYSRIGFAGGMNLSGTGVASSSWRAPIFYDLDDTGYYIDPNSTSNTALRMRGGALFGPNTSWSAYLMVGANGNGTGGSYGSVAVTNGNLHLDAASGYEMYLNHYYGNNVYYSYGGSIRGGFYTDSSVRASLFYDADNTGYYVNPNSSSYLNIISTANYIRSGANIYTDANYGYGLVGVYDSYRLQGVFAMGDSYKLAADGTSAGSLYGLAWSHPNAGGVASNLNNHGLLLLLNGGFNAAISSRAVFTEEVRGTLFRDYNDSGYYVDPNSTSRMYQINFNYLFYAADTNYGFLGSNLFADTLNSGYASDPLELCYSKGSWCGISHDSLRAPIYYDYNDTGYYVDPNSASQFAQVLANDWFRPQGGCGVYWQSYGRGIRAADSENSYGNIGTYGSGLSGWQGYSLHSYSLMGRSGTDIGLYDASSGHWIIYSLYNTSYIGLNSSTTSSSYSVYVSGSLYATSNITAYSDRRKKKNIVTVDNALDKVTKLRGVYYERIDNPVPELQDTRELGVIAQEVNEVMPEVVTYAKDRDEYGVSYGNFAGLFIEAFKEMKKEIEDLKKEIAELKGQS